MGEFSETRVQTWGYGFDKIQRQNYEQCKLSFSNLTLFGGILLNCEETMRGIHLTSSNWDIPCLAYNSWLDT